MDLNNQFLVSMPTLKDFSFSKTVIYMNDYSLNGAFGWVVNRQLDNEVSERLRKGMGLQKTVPLFYGGPVDVNNAYVLHTNDFKIPSTVELNSNLSVTRDKAIINVFNLGQFPEYWRIIVGHSQWGPGQLEDEMVGLNRPGRRSSWTHCPYTEKLMWNTMPAKQWDTAIQMSAENMTDRFLNF